MRKSFRGKRISRFLMNIFCIIYAISLTKLGHLGRYNIRYKTLMSVSNDKTNVIIPVVTRQFHDEFLLLNDFQFFINAHRNNRKKNWSSVYTDCYYYERTQFEKVLWLCNRSLIYDRRCKSCMKLTEKQANKYCRKLGHTVILHEKKERKTSQNTIIISSIFSFQKTNKKKIKNSSPKLIN